MVLSRRDILGRIEKGDLSFDPIVPDSAIKQVSVDLRIGKIFTRFKAKEELPRHIAAIRFTPDIFLQTDLWDRVVDDSYFLKPNEFVLAKTHEFVRLPNDLMGLIEGRSSWARIGLGVHVTAPKIDPGFRGTITLELNNYGSATIELRAASTIRVS
jgi:dCTP deaminase